MDDVTTDVYGLGCVLCHVSKHFKWTAQKVDDIGLFVKSFFEVNSGGIDEIWEEEDWSERNIQASFFVEAGGGNIWIYILQWQSMTFISSLAPTLPWRPVCLAWCKAVDKSSHTSTGTHTMILRLVVMFIPAAWMVEKSECCVSVKRLAEKTISEISYSTQTVAHAAAIMCCLWDIHCGTVPRVEREGGNSSEMRSVMYDYHLLVGCLMS